MGHLGQRFRKAGFLSVENKCKIRWGQGCHHSGERMKLESMAVWLVVMLLGPALAQVRWGERQEAGQGGGGGGYNPGNEFPALGGEQFPPLGQPSTNPGVDCRNETTGVFGPCIGETVASFSQFFFLFKIIAS